MLFKAIKKINFVIQNNCDDLIKSHIPFRTYALSTLISSLLVTGGIITARQWGTFQDWELSAYDKMVNLHKSDRVDDKLLLVEITDTDIKNQNSWPISDQAIAQMLATLQQYEPKVIGLDLYRDIAYPPGNKALQKQLQADNIIAIEYLGNGSNRVSPPMSVPPQRVGFNDVVLDTDSVLRRNLMYARLKDQEVYSFSLRLSLEYLKHLPDFNDNLDVKVTPNSLSIGSTVLHRLQSNAGSYQMLPSEANGWQILIDYQSQNTPHIITLTEVLEGKFNPSLVKDKVVIIGTTAPSIKDLFFTPYDGFESTMAGALVHAKMTSQIISLVLGESTQFWFWNQGLESLWIWSWSLIGIAIAWKLRHPLSISLATVSAIAILYGICLLCFFGGGWIPFVPSILTLVLTTGTILTYNILYTTLYDSLTGLPNQTLFNKQLKKLQAKYLQTSSTKSIVVFCLDLDRFKLINDGLGYEAGDKLLLMTAQLLREHIGFEELLARVGGDEFAIAIVVEGDPSVALKLAHQLQEKVSVPFRFNNRETLNSVTIGIAINDITENSSTPKSMLRSARTAMYKAKASGKIRHEIFANKMHEQALMRLQLETDLYQAIQNREFQLYYQPIISLETAKISGFEALVRWISPEKGFISPGEFIPIAEETGAIIPLGEWILQEACHQMYQWQQQFTNYSDLFISVNLSGRQFHQPNLVEKITQIVDLTKIDYSNLKLEITESMVMDNVKEAIAMLNSLKDLGIRLSMDDFGTGFSSFSYLHQFPMDTLKVDRSFVSNMSQGTKNLEIVSTIIMLAHKLGMDVIAEGIETKVEQELLEGLDCEYGQGYLFAKPLPAAEATKLLHKY